VSSLSKWKPAGAKPGAVTAINTEWGCYGSDLLPRVQEDVDLDHDSGAVKGGWGWCGGGLGVVEGWGVRGGW